MICSYDHIRSVDIRQVSFLWIQEKWSNFTLVTYDDSCADVYCTSALWIILAAWERCNILTVPCDIIANCIIYIYTMRSYISLYTDIGLFFSVADSNLCAWHHCCLSQTLAQAPILPTTLHFHPQTCTFTLFCHPQPNHHFFFLRHHNFFLPSYYYYIKYTSWIFFYTETIFTKSLHTVNKSQHAPATDGAVWLWIRGVIPTAVLCVCRMKELQQYWCVTFHCLEISFSFFSITIAWFSIQCKMFLHLD